ncbi:hypothetical protein O9929_27265 [Vibrio lentus]|nr:hypothetical protein [Vibrio lentus]
MVTSAVGMKTSIRYLGGLGYGDINMTFIDKVSKRSVSTAPNEGVELGLKGMGGIQKLQFSHPTPNGYWGFQQFFAPTLSLNNHPKSARNLKQHWQHVTHLFRSGSNR